MKKYICLIIAAILTMATNLSPFVFIQMGPIDMGIVIVIAIAYIVIAFLLGCISGQRVKFLYPVVATVLFVLMGLILYLEFLDFSGVRYYGIATLIMTLIGVCVGSGLRQIVVSIIRKISKKKDE